MSGGCDDGYSDVLPSVTDLDSHGPVLWEAALNWIRIEHVDPYPGVKKKLSLTRTYFLLMKIIFLSFRFLLFKKFVITFGDFF